MRHYYSDHATCGLSLTRRQMMHSGVLSGAGWAIASRLAAADIARVEAAKQGKAVEAKAPKAKAVIQVWLSGGPTHTDTFDPKPDSGSDYTGPLSHPIETNVSGIRIGELLPELAKVADKYSLIRSMTHGQNGHETASYLTQTGRMPGRLVYPAAGAVVTAFKGFPEDDKSNSDDQKGAERLIPPYIVLTEPMGRFSEAGFMGIRYKPFATGGDPNARRFEVEGIISKDLSDNQQRQRRELLGRLNSLGKVVGDNAALQLAAGARNEAYDLIVGDAGRVFDLDQEPGEMRDRYGRTKFGQSCLAARRLIENGSKFVTINHGGWDTHKDHFASMRRKLPDLDRGLGTLIADLSDRGMLDDTIVWCIGEFGRSPKVAMESPWNGGRHHFGACFSSLIAGGGFKGGQILGESDSRGETVKNRPVYPGDLIGTMYELLGIDPEASLPHPMGEFVRATPGKDEGLESGGRLTELI
ncbi:DUF1501 domain-containing protein [Aporhodopirellula aestuarii]|uniref:DUF1501 domain-containing protein n=1 Tax=Aporhodopirellula aestuarii TaxID=2950107 RepID=A0ABT0U9K7_9BACT|nr:DUF1501 domain-containing protein [Aporhodopirellula aestuarii]MCM2373374.1 DUF1501 domain-containing protein [Aporhodopirellula aestuarii]